MTAGVPRKRWAYVIPVAVVMYMLAYLDRTNVAVILPYIGDDFPLSAGAKGPYLVGWLIDVTGGATTGFVVLAAFLAVAAGLAFFGLKPALIDDLEDSAHVPASTRNP
ncbi:hypothetical protein [Amycolatopsis sp. NPDC051128]|uniref:hypothetical protein n=1 Tax=Amycolatopsis sp. NPDC051128 TaxID=3155412 RepID=UPI003434174F